MADTSRSTSRRVLRGGLAAAGAALLAQGAVHERRHLRRLAADPELRELTAPLGGRPLGEIVSGDGTRLYAEEFGFRAPSSQRPTLVFAHGWTERINFWGPVIRRLAGPSLRVVAYDLRGHGASAPAAGG